MQKTEWRILSTRPVPEALLHEAAAHNIIIDVVSFIETESVVDDTTAAQIRQLLQKPITAVFTSMNAVSAVAQLFQKPIAWTVYSIGTATATLIRQLFQMPIAGTAINAEALADVIIKDGVKKVTFFCGDMRRDVLPEKLRAANISVAEIVVYRTKETPQVVAASYDALLFYSPSAVQSFFSANDLNAETTVFAIGTTTADAVRKHTANHLIIASKTGKEDLVREMIAYFNQQKKEWE